MMCPKCQQRVMEGASRCPACGASLKTTWLGWLLRRLIPEQVLKQLKEAASTMPVTAPDAEEHEFCMVVDSVTPKSGDSVLVHGRFSGTGELRQGDHVALTLSDKTLKTCEVLSVHKMGDLFGLDVFSNFISLKLSGISAQEISAKDTLKKV